MERLYAAHADALLVYLTRRVGEPETAMDLWAETFAQATLRRRRFRGSTADEAAAWLYGIARRQLAGFHRRGYAERRALDRLRLERAPAPPSVLEELQRRAGLDQLRVELAAALEQLTPAVREAVRLRVVEKLAYPELSLRLGATEQAVRARVSRGLSTLADTLDASTIKETIGP